MHRKHDYSVRLFDDHDAFVEHFSMSGRADVESRVKAAIDTSTAAWARIYNETLHKRVDRWKLSKDTSHMEIIRSE